MTGMVQAVVSRRTSRNDLINDSSKQLLEMVPIRGLTRSLFCGILLEWKSLFSVNKKNNS
jgi:hypothetical protein